MPDTKGHLLPVYVLADESYSMLDYVGQLNAGLASLYETVRSEPMIAAKVRLCVLGFSDDVAVRLGLADLRDTDVLPQMAIRTNTNYHAAFTDLLRRIPGDVGDLKSSGYKVHRPVIYFLSDGQPNPDGANENWTDTHRRLVDKERNATAPNIIACGVGDVEAQTILDVATQPEFAFIAPVNADIGSSIAKFFVALTTSVVLSGRSMNSRSPQLFFEKPEGFHMAIDEV
ncbi:MAG TPA: hypothetical protein VMI33_16710 [Streptosporangiaceae bacterium]|nr:hypothetical protein [Streptosporangiaceae bacterium]